MPGPLDDWLGRNSALVYAMPMPAAAACLCSALASSLALAFDSPAECSELRTMLAVVLPASYIALVSYTVLLIGPGKRSGALRLIFGAEVLLSVLFATWSISATALAAETSCRAPPFAVIVAHVVGFWLVMTGAVIVLAWRSISRRSRAH